MPLNPPHGVIVRILGIDPGTLKMGYALLDDEGPSLMECGVLVASRRDGMGQRLHNLYQELLIVLQRLAPSEVAVEAPYVSQDKSRRTAIAVGQGQAVALMAAAAAELRTYTYAPAQVKRSVTDYGASSKEQVQEMVRLQLGLTEPPQPFDAADAIAVALCHLRQRHVARLISSGGES